VAGAVILALLLLDYLLAPHLLDARANELNIPDQNEGPSWAHWLGTDGLGRDILARTLVGAHISLEIAVGSACLAVVIGTTLGVATATITRHARQVVARAIDTMIAFPALILVIFIGTIFKPGAVGAMIGVGLAASFRFARLVSNLALAIGGRDFIAAARVVGARRLRLMYRHILPNIAEPLLVAAAFILSFGLIANAGLSFLGLGVQPPEYDWGQLLTEGVKTLYSNPAAALGPAAAISIAALGFGFFGEALARATNPLLWTPDRDGTSVPAAGWSSTEKKDDPGGMVASEPAAQGGGGWNTFLSVRDLTVTFPGPQGPVDVVAGVSFVVPRGGVLGIVGESGSGKTMTALATAQLVPYPGTVTGGISVDGRDLTMMTKRELDGLLGAEVGMVFQDPLSALNPALTIGRQLTEAVRVHRGLTRRDATTRALGLLEEVHIPNPRRQMNRYPHEFSGGMRQRAMIAMRLMTDPQLLICDEPTTALDVTVQAQIMDVLNEVNQRHKTAIVLISHNLPLVAQNCERVLVMYGGRVVEDLSRAELRAEPLHPYTQALLAAAPDRDEVSTVQRPSIPSEVSSTDHVLRGCAFHARCPLAISRCSHERPPLRRLPTGRRLACHVSGTSTPPD
jgi:oligopeptide/dipeptide ABC transporter ATP-binding protein